jgi:protein ImuB
MPFACLFVPDFPVQAVVRLDPELAGKPVAVFAGAPPLTKVFSVSPLARKLGVAAGLTKLQAESFTGITWRWRSLPQEATARAALLDCAWTISPRVEDISKSGDDALPDTVALDGVVLDIGGCEKLFGSAEKIARDLLRVAAEVGFAANVAVAANPSAAICAAQGFAGVTVIPLGEEAMRIGELSLAALRAPAELLETLERWGIRSCRDFAALPEIAVIERLGQDGRRWQQLARGADPRPLIAKEFPLEFEECMELDSPVESLEPLLFVLNRLLDQLCTRIRMHLLAIAEMKVTLELQPPDMRQKGELRHIRTLRLPIPAKESKFLLKLLQLDLQAHPPTSEVVAVRILAIPTTARSRQLGLFLPLSPEPERLEVTLARIQNTVGEGRVGAPVLLDTHRPNAFEQNRFVVKDAAEQKLAHARTAIATAALRIYRPPLPATVDLHDGKPARLACSGVQRQIFAFAGPWRTKGDWWSETAWARDEWDVELRALQPRPRVAASIAFDANIIDSAGDATAQTETALYRIYKDLRSKRWFVEGIYD